MNYTDFLSSDLESASIPLADSIGALRDKKILVSGATGFFGQWLLYFLIHLNKKFNLHIEVYCLSRNPDTFLAKHPQIDEQEFIHWASVDIAHQFYLEFSPDFVFHMATDVPTSTTSNNSESFDSIVAGTKNMLQFLSSKNKKCKMLLTSSGAVYGKQPVEISHLKESYVTAPHSQGPDNYYAKAKIASELLCSNHLSNNPDFKYVSARCFAFSGPFLAQDKNYAIGNFVRDLVDKKDIVVLGNGTAKRSYMYGADLVSWLVMLLIEGQSGEAYNVGSDHAISIGELAHKVAGFDSQIKVEIKKSVTPDDILEQYVPSIEKAKSELNLKLNNSLEYGIQRMIDFNLHFLK